MRVSRRLRGVQFEWDSDKAKANLVKHAVSFEQACKVFFDPFVRLIGAPGTLRRGFEPVVCRPCDPP
jgi:hypothetical protein